jgi:hypothetical protein
MEQKNGNKEEVNEGVQPEKLPETEAPKQEAKKKYICEICGKEFSSFKALNSHMKVHKHGNDGIIEGIPKEVPTKKKKVTERIEKGTKSMIKWIFLFVGFVVVLVIYLFIKANRIRPKGPEGSGEPDTEMSSVKELH